MSRPILVYIAGPYRAPTPWQIQAHIRAAAACALRVWQTPGLVALCPHLNTALFDGEAPDAVWLEGDLELLRRCDLVWLIPGWEWSTGACAEKVFAETVAEVPVATSWEGLLDLVQALRILRGEG